MDRPLRKARALPSSVLVLALVAALAGSLSVAAGAEAKASVPSSFFGVSATLPTEHDFARMGKTGFGAYRFDINWAGVQKTREGGYDWSGVDPSVRQAAVAGMQPTPLLIGTPRFIRSSADGLFPPTGSEQDQAAWQGFLAAATRRYGPGGAFWAENPDLPALPVSSWIIWNEENARAFWHPKPNPADYARLVKISDEAISQVDPEAQIVLGGIYGYPKDSRSISAVDFLRRLYEADGIERHFDAINLHPYGSGVGTVRKQITQARSAARKAGDRNVGILIGEIGWASSGPSRSDEVVGSKGQATRLRGGMQLLANKRRAWDIVGVYVYVWRDFLVESACLWCPGAGLLEVDGTAKPALRAVRSVIRATR